MDSLGFHQTDNHPTYDLQPVTETPEVKKARKEHERLWKAAARNNGADFDSNDLYNPNAERLENENYDDDQELEGQVSNQHQSLARYPVLPYSKHIAPENAKRFGKVIDDSVIVESNEIRSRFARQHQNEEEVTSEPRGFFYKFDYPVPFIAARNARSKRFPDALTSDNEEISARNRINNSNVSSQKPLEHAGIQRVSQSIVDGAVPEDEVHDVQTSPKQKIVSGKESFDAKTEKSAAAQKSIKMNRGTIKFKAQKN